MPCVYSYILIFILKSFYSALMNLSNLHQCKWLTWANAREFFRGTRPLADTLLLVKSGVRLNSTSKKLYNHLHAVASRGLLPIPQKNCSKHHSHLWHLVIASYTKLKLNSESHVWMGQGLPPYKNDMAPHSEDAVWVTQHFANYFIRFAVPFTCTFHPTWHYVIRLST